MPETTCSICGHVSPNVYQSTLHRREKHPEIRRQRKAATQPSAFDRLLDAKQFVQTAIKDLEFEREQLHRRVLQYDDAIAKYKKLL